MCLSVRVHVGGREDEEEAGFSSAFGGNGSFILVSGCCCRYKISKEDEVSMEDGKVPLAMPRKFGMLPDFKQLGLVANDLVDSFKWRTLSVAFVAVM